VENAIDIDQDCSNIHLSLLSIVTESI